MMKGVRLFAWAVVVEVLLATSGCATVPRALDLAGNAPGFSYGAGRGSQSFQAPISAVTLAVHESMGDLEITSIRPKREGAVARVEGTTSDHRRVVAMLHTNQGVTQVAIRIGWFGDEPLSQALVERIGVRLGTRTPESIPASPPSAPTGNPFFSRGSVPDWVMLRDFAEAPYRDRVIP